MVYSLLAILDQNPFQSCAKRPQPNLREYGLDRPHSCLLSKLLAVDQSVVASKLSLALYNSISSFVLQVHLLLLFLLIWILSVV